MNNMDFGEHENAVEAQIERTNVVLFVGAGVNGGSENRRGRHIAGTWDLTQILCAELGEKPDGVSLADAALAAETTLGRDRLNKILLDEFRFTKPSKEIDKLFKYAWRRVYTWNYDDSMLEASRTSVQRVHAYNGMSDSVEEIEGSADLQLVFLHGMIQFVQKGIVLTDQEYSVLLQDGGHDWYRRAAQDVRAFLPIFIGTSLNEPVLASELERASRGAVGSAGKGFVVTPDVPSGVRRRALEARGFVHAQGTLADFLGWLELRVGNALSPAQVVEKSGPFNEANIGRFSDADIVAAQTLKPILPTVLANKLASLKGQEKASLGRRYLNGFPPTFLIAQSDIPVLLEQSKELNAALDSFLESDRDLFVTVGQAGSGKTTATMQGILKSVSSGKFELFEISDDAPSMRDALSILARMNERPKVLYISSLFIFGAALRDDLEFARNANVKIVTTCRSSEWREHFERYFGKSAHLFEFRRFGRSDFDPLIERLRQYVPAPTFTKLPHPEQVKRLAQSKSQLLIALREATESKTFSDLIVDEFSNIENRDAQDLVILVGLATLARVGLDFGTASEAYNRRKRETGFDRAIYILDGIVAKSQSGRLLGRHEFYIRDVLDQAVSLERVFGLLYDLTSTFTKFKIPITRHVNRQNAILFRFLLNHSFVRERAERGGNKMRGIEYYSSFEVPFQLDGHFWLQYGLYYQRIGDSKMAIEMFEKSVEAFPDNPFTVHALASEKLHEAFRLNGNGRDAERLISDAVSSLERLSARDYDYYDHYPVVTLARFYIPILLKMDRMEEARDRANDYFERLKALERRVTSRDISEAKALLLLFLSTGVWEGDAQRRLQRRR